MISELVLDAVPDGILSRLDEECKVPGGSDSRFLHKVRMVQNEYLEAPKLAKDLFKIKHYAGPVSYSCSGFLEKNRDTVHTHLVEMMQISQSEFIRNLFQQESDSASRKVNNCVREKKAGCKGSVNLESVGGEFKRQLLALTNAIEGTQVHYIRCINSNPYKTAGLFSTSSASHQLRCGGVVEAVRVTRAGFPARFAHGTFCKLYRTLAPPMSPAKRRGFEADHATSKIRVILTAHSMAVGVDFEIGTTKIFLREGR